MIIRYSSLLAVTKFRTRFGRSVMTVIAASLVASIMLIASFVGTGLEAGVRGVSETRLSRMNLVRETVYGAGPEVLDNPDKVPVPKITLEDYKKRVEPHGAKAVYEEANLGSWELVDPEPKAAPVAGPGPFRGGFESSSAMGIVAQSDDLYRASLDTENPPEAQPGTIPAIVNTSTVLSLAGVVLSDSDTAAAKVEKTKGVLDAWRGKVLTFAGQSAEEGGEPGPGFKLTIQGYSSSGGFLGMAFGGQMTVPLDRITPELKAASEQIPQKTFFASFANEDDVTTFIKDNGNKEVDGNFLATAAYGNPMLMFREMRESVGTALKYLVGVLLAAVALAMTTTLSKIIADSERETGVFTAIGAKASDIVQIYFTYAMLISVLAMVLALLIGSGVAQYLTVRFGNDLSYQLISLSGTGNLGLRVSLLGVNPLHLLQVFAAIVAAAILGTLLPLFSLLRKDPIKALRAE